MRPGVLAFASVSILLAGCASSDATSSSEDGLTEEDFLAQYTQKYCDEWSSCNTSGAGCDTYGTAGPGGSSDCRFDPAAAQACLDEAWACNTDFPGFEFPNPPDVCAAVCDGTTPGSES